MQAAAGKLGLTELLQRKPHALSGGQRQRVALGRAIVRDPKVFLFDEPLSNLDAALRVTTRNELIRQQREIGTTSIYVTHDQVEAMTMGDRICIMNQGKVVQIGRPLEVLPKSRGHVRVAISGQPADEPVARAPRNESDDGIVAHLPGGTLRAADAHGISARPIRRRRSDRRRASGRPVREQRRHATRRNLPRILPGCRYASPVSSRWVPRRC